jgi:hypothetical protein
VPSGTFIGVLKISSIQSSHPVVVVAAAVQQNRNLLPNKSRKKAILGKNELTIDLVGCRKVSIN